MAEISQEDQLRLHEFSVRYRAALAKKYPAPENSLDTVKDAVREQYEQEQTAEREKKPAPDTAKEQERQPPEPDHER